MRRRGGTFDEAFPVTAATRPAPLPKRAESHYAAHRLTLPAADGKRLACDCGAEFDSATELEAHQGYYRQGLWH